MRWDIDVKANTPRQAEAMLSDDENLNLLQRSFFSVTGVGLVFGVSQSPLFDGSSLLSEVKNTFGFDSRCFGSLAPHYLSLSTERRTEQ